MKKQQATNSARPGGGRKFWSLLKEFLVIVLIALLVSTAVKTWLVRAFYIPSASMEDTLQIGDRVLVNRLAASTDSVDRGDIVVFDDPANWLPAQVSDEYAPNPVLEFLGLAPSDAGHQLIKRVIGTGGDEVACCDAEGRLTVNGEPITETYLPEGVEPSQQEFSVTVPAGHYWMMGDNRGNSADSRAHIGGPGGGFVPHDDVIGTVFVINWPMSRLSWMSNPEDVFAGVPAP